MKKRSGWPNDSYEHALASQGIPTKGIETPMMASGVTFSEEGKEAIKDIQKKFSEGHFKSVYLSNAEDAEQEFDDARTIFQDGIHPKTGEPIEFPVYMDLRKVDPNDLSQMGKMGVAIHGSSRKAFVIRYGDESIFDHWGSKTGSGILGDWHKLS